MGKHVSALAAEIASAFDADFAARNCALFSRLTPVWQDEEELLEGLRQPHRQAWVVAQSRLVERRRLTLPKVRWQLRLAG